MYSTCTISYAFWWSTNCHVPARTVHRKDRRYLTIIQEMLQCSIRYESTTRGAFDAGLLGNSGPQIVEVSAPFCNQAPPRWLQQCGGGDFLGTTCYACLQLLAEVALSTPFLWNDIYLNFKQAGFHNSRYYPPLSLLLRSCSAPLHIAAHVINYTNHGSEPTKLYEALRTITNRAETFQLRWDGTLQAGIMDVLRHPFPQLTSLTLCLKMDGSALPETLFGRELPRLRCLSLWFYNCWPHHKFPNLTHIALNDQQSRPSINEFLDLLESTPHLEFLYLCEAGPKIYRTTILPQRAVSLPSLQIAQFTTKISADPDNLRILECLTMRQLTPCLVRSVHRPPILPDSFETIFTHINLEGIVELCVYQHRRYFHALEVDASRISIQTTPKALVTLPAPRLTSSWNIKHLHLVSDVGIPEVDWNSFPHLLLITCYDSLNGIKDLMTSSPGVPVLCSKPSTFVRENSLGGWTPVGMKNCCKECWIVSRSARLFIGISGTATRLRSISGLTWNISDGGFNYTTLNTLKVVPWVFKGVTGILDNATSPWRNIK